MLVCSQMNFCKEFGVCIDIMFRTETEGFGYIDLLRRTSTVFRELVSK